MKRRDVRLCLSLFTGLLVLAYVIGVIQQQRKIIIFESTTITTDQTATTQGVPSKPNNYNNNSRSSRSSSSSNIELDSSVSVNDLIGKTKVVAFCNYNYRSVGLVWYQRMTDLGYTTHFLVATDVDMVQFLKAHNNNKNSNNNNKKPYNIRFDVLIHSPLPEKYSNKPRTKQDHYILELLMAVRWKYLLHQLKYGIHILLTDVDNIFTSYHDPLISVPPPSSLPNTGSIEQSDNNKNNNIDLHNSNQDDIPPMIRTTRTIDVWHAYATKYPRRTFSVQGFVVCSGMSWWRSSPASIQYAQLMQHTCGDMCDDQRVLNVLLEKQMNMTWNWTPDILQSRIVATASSNINSNTNDTTTTSITDSDPRYVGLLTKSLRGQSQRVPGLQLGIWDRNFAFRGPLYPNPCPNPTWVSMPVLEASSRGKAWLVKAESFAEWDKHCGGGSVTVANQ